MQLYSYGLVQPEESIQCKYPQPSKIKGIDLWSRQHKNYVPVGMDMHYRYTQQILLKGMY